jgi:hypothetical protein
LIDLPSVGPFQRHPFALLDVDLVAQAEVGVEKAFIEMSVVLSDDVNVGHRNHRSN